MTSSGLGDLRHSCYDSVGLALTKKGRRSHLLENLLMNPPMIIIGAVLTGWMTQIESEVLFSQVRKLRNTCRKQNGSPSEKSSALKSQKSPNPIARAG